eukprot:TRINITY_DN1686_c0_g1_i2.p2 TRINITY_DN1686_c0_g1~~TRINITY_DN1686_c0_g1_i2.p2  ORF type:complete len:110 (-),score=33.42 TRINITY_DN1686_c0_g1_i2:40-369(-)
MLSLADYTSYWANLTRSNDAGIVWEKLYSIRDTYQLDDLSVDSMKALAQRLAYDDDTWCTFFKHWFVEQDYVECDLACRKSCICSILFSAWDDFVACQARINIQAADCG